MEGLFAYKRREPALKLLEATTKHIGFATFKPFQHVYGEGPGYHCRIREANRP